MIKDSEGRLTYALHQAHNKNGKALDWDDATAKFNGNAAFIKDRNGEAQYKEVTITIYEGSIKAGLDRLQQKYNDPNLTSEEAIVTVGTHEHTHDTDKATINAVMDRQEGTSNSLDVEVPATQVEIKTAGKSRRD